MSTVDKRIDTDVPKNVRLYGTELTGNTVIPLALDQSGQISVSLETADTLIAKVSGETLIVKNSGQIITAKISGDTVVVASGAYVVTGAAITLDSGSVVMPEAFSISSGKLSVSSGQLIAKVSGEVVSVASGVEIIWRTPITSGSVIVSGSVSVSGSVVTAASGIELIWRTPIISGSVIVSGTVSAASGVEVIHRPANNSGLVVNSYIKSPIDATDGDLVTIDAVHHEIHEGKYFEAYTYAENAGTISGVVLHLLTPVDATRIHWAGIVESDVAAVIELWENVTVGTSGTVVTVYNRNRDSVTTAETLAFSQPGYTSGSGSLLQKRYIGIDRPATQLGGSIRNNSERILKSGTNYIVKVIPSASPSKVFVGSEWYEVG